MDYKTLFDKLEQTLAPVQRSDDTLAMLSTIVRRLVTDFREDLGLVRGRIYVREDDAFILREEHPDAGPGHLGFALPMTYGPVRQLLEQGFVLHEEPTDSGLAREIEDALGVRSFAAISVGESPPYLVAFSLRDSSDREHVIYMLNTIRHVVNLELRKERLEDRLAEARSIQMSLLPAASPRFADYDIHGATLPAEEVGGDLYDFISVSERSLGVAIADAAGHGLPAALQARDAIIGLRMGVEERWRITATVEKLNKVIGRSALVSRFISLFYCELDPNGTLVYCNAGHNPPLLYREGRFTELTRGGAVLGPNPEAHYERGYEEMAPGTVLLAYTDGIVEAENPEGEAFDTGRLRDIVAGRSWSTARELVGVVFDAVRSFSDVSTPRDDQTVVAVLRGPRPGIGDRSIFGPPGHENSR